MTYLENPEADSRQKSATIGHWHRLGVGLAWTAAFLSLSTLQLGASSISMPANSFAIALLAAFALLNDRESLADGHNQILGGGVVVLALVDPAIIMFGANMGVVTSTGSWVSTLLLVLLGAAIVVRPLDAFWGMLGTAAAFGIVLFVIVSMSYGQVSFVNMIDVQSLFALIFVTLAIVSNFSDGYALRALVVRGTIGERTRAFAFVGSMVPWFCGGLLYYQFGVPQRDILIEAVLVTLMMLTGLGMALLSGRLAVQAQDAHIASERSLQMRACTDHMTGLLNRDGMMQQLSSNWKDFISDNEARAVIMFDLDHFKIINDTHGHDVGDDVLRAVGAAVAPHLRQEDALGRWGGEEFLCILKGAKPDQLADIGERLRAAIEELSDPISDVLGKECQISASFGVGMFENQDIDFEQAIKRADLALYMAKRGGRNRIEYDANACIENPSLAREPQNALIA